MSRHKAKSFHCQKCGAPCTIYKKGKAHRVLVCPSCGVIATNPTVAGSILKAGASMIPVFGGVASSLIGDAQSRKANKTASPSMSGISSEHHNKTSFEKALMLELLERG
jgi:ribosomal protein S27E